MANRNSNCSAEGLAKLRREYCAGELDEGCVPSNPFELFSEWLRNAADAGVVEPNAMVLATVSADGTPSARTVLLKEYDESGLSFFTNYLSQKGQELQRNPRATALFLWTPLERQVRVTGEVEKLPRELSVAYFKTRPRDAQLAAAISPQSQVVESRRALELMKGELERQLAGKEVDCPPHWGGYRLRPSAFEFWQGRPGRLHDRLTYRLCGTSWALNRLAP